MNKPVLYLGAITLLCLSNSVTAEGEAMTCSQLATQLLEKHSQDYSDCARTSQHETKCSDVDELAQDKKQVNVLIVLDASGSMKAHVGGKPKMQVAKNVVNKFAEGLPDSFNVGLLVYGHKGTGKDLDKALSCEGSELLYEIDQYDASSFENAVNSFQASGWTAIAGSLKLAGELLQPLVHENTENIIYLVSDGIETCDGSPAIVANELNNNGITTAINIIGFDVDNSAQTQLKEVSHAGNGVYHAVKNAQEFNDVFDRQRQELLKRLGERRNCKIDGAIENANTEFKASIDQRQCVINKAKVQRSASLKELVELESSDSMPEGCSKAWSVKVNIQSEFNKVLLKADRVSKDSVWKSIEDRKESINDANKEYQQDKNKLEQNREPLIN